MSTSDTSMSGQDENVSPVPGSIISNLLPDLKGTHNPSIKAFCLSRFLSLSSNGGALAELAEDMFAKSQIGLCLDAPIANGVEVNRNLYIEGKAK